jgi:hypothetical protein
MIQQLTIKLSIEPNLHLASIDTDYGIYSFHGQDAMTIASFVERYIDTDLELPNDSTIGVTNKSNRIVLRLLADAKNLLQDSFSEEEFKQTFSVIKVAKTRGFLGAHKPSDCCLAELVNIANDILRTRKFDEVELNAVTQQPKALYVYVALVAVGLISA